MKTVRILHAALVLALSGHAVSAWAGGECGPCSRPYAKCIQGAAGMVYAIQACQSDEKVRQDAALDAAYTAALRRLSAERQAELQATQALWVQYRTANMRFEVGQGQSGAKVAATTAALELTARRVAELRRIKE